MGLYPFVINIAMNVVVKLIQLTATAEYLRHMFNNKSRRNFFLFPVLFPHDL